MSKAIKELIGAAKSAARWMREATPPGELNKPLRTLEAAIKRAEQSRETQRSSGSLLLLELPDGRKRITATVESADKYLSRAGWNALGVEAEVAYSAEVPDLEQARETLRAVLQEEQWRGQGMTWTDLSEKDLITAIKKVVAVVNKERSL
jgi:hypothetical protein